MGNNDRTTDQGLQWSSNNYYFTFGKIFIFFIDLNYYMIVFNLSKANRKLLYSTSSDHTARCWVMEFGDCTRSYKEHTHSVSAIIENDGLGKIIYSFKT